MRILFLFIVFLACFSVDAQEKKFIKALKSDDPKKIEKTKQRDDFQDQLDYHLVYAVHTFDSLLLNKCIELGANVHSPCGDCYGRDAITVALYYQNYNAYYQLKPIYEYSGKLDEFGANILHAAATCKAEILEEVISSYHPEFVIGNGGSPLYMCLTDTSIISEKAEILLTYYFEENKDKILQEKHPDFGTNLLVDAVYSNDLELVKHLHQLGFDPMEFPTEFETDSYCAEYVGSPFITSLMHSDHKIYDYFVSQGFDIKEIQGWKLPAADLMNEYGEVIYYSNPSFFISLNSNIDFVKTIENQVDIDYNVVEDIENYTPMLLAIIENNTGMVEHIIDYGWDGYYYKTAIKWAKEKGKDPKIEEMLNQYVLEYIK